MLDLQGELKARFQEELEALPASDDVDWVQCEDCDQWVPLPASVAVSSLPANFVCSSSSTWADGAVRCSDDVGAAAAAGGGVVAAAAPVVEAVVGETTKRTQTGGGGRAKKRVKR